MSFLNELQKATNKTLTENGAVANSSTLDYNLDYFSLAGAMRHRVGDSELLFEKAYRSDRLTALRTLFYLRDIRGGQGERDIFRAGLRVLERIDPLTAEKIIREGWVGEYGRFDDLFIFDQNSSLSEIAKFVKKQFEIDEESMKRGESISLLAKWLPSENSSSPTHRKQAQTLAKLLEMTPRQYRVQVVKFRKYISLLEQKMSEKKWNEIDYSKLPSQASRKHVAAFMRHDETRFRDFLEKARKGEVKINTSTLFTYEIYDLVRSNPDAADAMWANLPDYTNGQNAIVLADVSGSMSGRPMSVSVSLALYFAEHNKGEFHNKFMTFSESPQVVDVIGDTLSEKLNFIETEDWGFNTNLEAAFDAILKAGTVSEELPKVLYVISDMEFDEACDDPSESIFDNAQRKFNEAGLTLPHVVFWSVSSHQNQHPATKFDNRVTLISGFNQSTFKYVVEGKSPVELMKEVVNSERYQRITI